MCRGPWKRLFWTLRSLDGYRTSYDFPMTAVIKYHGPDGFKPHKGILFISGGQKSGIQMSAGPVPSAGSKGGLSLPLPASGVCCRSSVFLGC